MNEFDSIYKEFENDLQLLLDKSQDVELKERLHKNFEKLKPIQAPYILEERYFSTIIIDKHFNMIDFNEKTQQIFGFAADSNLNICDWVTDSSKIRLKEHIQQVIDNNDQDKVEICEIVLKNSKNSLFNYKLHSQAIHLPEHGIVCRSILIDITDCKSFDKYLQESERKFRRTVEMAGIGIAHITLDGYLITYNRKFNDFHDHSIEFIANSTIKQMPLFEDNLVGYHWIENLAKQNQKSIVFIKNLKVKKNDILWLKLTISLVQDQFDQPAFFIAYIEDITKTVQAEETLEKYGNIFKYVEQGIFVISTPDYKIDMANAAFYKTLGYNDEELKGKFVYNILNFDSLGDIKRIFDDTQNKNSSILKISVTRKDQTEFPAEIHINSIKTKESKIDYWVVTLLDLSEIQKIESEMNLAKLKAQEFEKLKTSFLNNISHEIRTPMNGILGFAELLKQKDLTDFKKDEYINTINLSTRKLLKTLSSILDMARIQSGSIALHEFEYSINLLLIELHAFASKMLDYDQKTETSIFLSHPLSSEDSKIIVDVDKLKQVLMHLIDNAIKFTQEGCIELGYTLEKEGYLNFFVKDTGIGISCEDQKMLFQTFNKSDDALNKNKGSNGLGLAISKAYIELMGGKIVCRSEIGKGTEFNFYLPLKRKALVSIEKPAKTEKKDYDWSSKTVLVVEDDKITFFFYRELLTKSKVKILHAISAEQAINIFKETPADLILMDIQLPEMSGFEAASEIRKIDDKVPIIAQTAYTSQEDIDKCHESGCSDYISKPVDPNRLIKLISGYFDKGQKV